MKKPTTIYLDRNVYDRLKELVAPKPVSQELNELMAKRVAELEGGEYDPLESANYEVLKKEYERLNREGEKLAKQLRKRKTYDTLTDMAIQCSIEQKQLSNIPEVAAKMLGKDDAPKDDVHLFISLLELAREMKEVERKLDEVRLGAKSGKQVMQHVAQPNGERGSSEEAEEMEEEHEEENEEDYDEDREEEYDG